jgi:eukaryotic-like serine/threonine-protein kinase
MGEVCLADDLNLNRKVALKFLPEEFADDPVRMARFEREARLVASLNHPNIAAIYGLEQAEGKRFLVLELVEGETLAQGISKGPLPDDEALVICSRMADGLEAAHDKGMIHRDLKPADVMITTVVQSTTILNSETDEMLLKWLKPQPHSNSPARAASVLQTS